MTKIIYLIFAVLSVFGFTACEDNLSSVESTEFTYDWANRNLTYFNERMAEAKQAINEAKAAHGDNWEEHCDWRTYLSYSKVEGVNILDSICVKIIDRGEGTESPLFTDQAMINYVGHLIPTENHPKGFAFDHSGLYSEDDYVFNPAFAAPRPMIVGNTVEGFSTALQYMHKGDRWMIYMPSILGFGSIAKPAIPPYSTLVFDVQLVSFKNIGVN